MITNEILPVTSHVRDFKKWIEDADRTERRLHPVNELFAEHHLADAVLAAMEREIRKLSVHGELRVEIWEGLVDFFGNFILQVHRRKEEQGLFPAFFEKSGRSEETAAGELAKEHAEVQGITVALFQGVSEGDWEKVLRAAHVYLKLARDHLPREEHAIFAPARLAFDESEESQLRLRFTELEKFGLGDRDRHYYLALARRLCTQVGLVDALAI